MDDVGHDQCPIALRDTDALEIMNTAMKRPPYVQVPSAWWELRIAALCDALAARNKELAEAYADANGLADKLDEAREDV